MVTGEVEVGQAGHQQAVLAPHPLQQSAPALLPQEDGAARSPGGQSVASTGPSCPPRAPGSVQVAETDTVTITSHHTQIKRQRLEGKLNVSNCERRGRKTTELVDIFSYKYLS